MLQRIQSIYLTVSLFLSVLTFFIPIGYLTDGVTEMQLTPYGMKDVSGQTMSDVSSYFFYIPLTLAITAIIISIFSFNHRSSQMKWVRLTFILFACAIALMALYIKEAVSVHSALSYQLGIGLALPILSVVFNRLALNAIKKDEDLVKSVDRIR